MAERDLILAIDQGTTSTRAIVFDRQGRQLGAAQEELTQHYPHSGWVEHDADEIWNATVSVCRGVLEKTDTPVGRIAGIGITNQRETTVIWDRKTGEPIHKAIVWQDRRTAEYCRRHFSDDDRTAVQRKTGLLIDPYFSATKIVWLLDNVDGARDAAERGDLAFGTIDTFLIWKLTGGRVHVTDATNACRTMLFNIHTLDWDDDMLRLLGIPRSLLPEVRDCAADFGTTDPDLLGEGLTIGGIAGDQQAALIGQACFQPGMIKSTYGTGCFLVLNTGETPVISENKLLTTVAYKLDGKATYAVEGSIFVAGAAIQWVRDGLKLIKSAGESEALAETLASNGGVYMVPAFVGLGAPYWDPDARGAIFGLSRDSGIAEIVRSALESVCYQTRDLVEATIDDGAKRPQALRVDGGMVANDWAMQFLADILAMPVERPQVIETTALGAAYLAGLNAGLYDSLDDIAQNWHRERLFEPTLGQADRDRLYEGWQDAVRRVRTR